MTPFLTNSSKSSGSLSQDCCMTITLNSHSNRLSQKKLGNHTHQHEKSSDGCNFGIVAKALVCGMRQSDQELTARILDEANEVGDSDFVGF